MLQYKDPQPPESWDGIRDATKEGTVSYQRSFHTGEIQGGEDCLFLNVYTPQVNENCSDLCKIYKFGKLSRSVRAITMHYVL